MEVTLYKVKKHINDVRGPYANDSFRLLTNVYLKSLTSVLYPEIEVQGSLDPTDYNYVYIPEFSRYYWVTNWSYNAGLWIGSLSVDVLATYKEQIEDSVQYVVRSENEFTSTMTDTMYPATNALTGAVNNAREGNFWHDLRTEGMYIVGLVGKGTVLETLDTGLVNYIAMDARAFAHFRSAVYDDTLAFYKKTGSFGDVSTELVKLLVDINEYVVSCVYVPYNPVGTAVTSVTIGFWTWDVPAGTVVKQIDMFTQYRFSRTIEIPKHPDYTSYGFYLNGSGFSSYTLSIPGVGMLPIDADALMRAHSVYIDLLGDSYSGAGKCKVTASIGEIPDSIYIELYNIPINIAVPISLAGSENATGGLLNGAMNLVSSIASKDVMGGLGSAVDTFSSIPAAATSVIGSQGNFESLREPLQLRAVFNKPSDRDVSLFGRPCCRIIKLSTLGDGYCQTANAHVEIKGAYMEELLQIEGYLNSGVHLYNSLGGVTNG